MNVMTLHLTEDEAGILYDALSHGFDLAQIAEICPENMELATGLLRTLSQESARLLES